MFGKPVESTEATTGSAQSRQPAASGPRARRVAPGRRWLLRLLAVLLGLSPFVAGELLFRWFDWGRPRATSDPFVGFAATQPLFVLSDDHARYQIPLGRQNFFAPESFPVNKADHEFRIFCLGGSTVQGRPYSRETSLTSWLELSLRAADPSRRWEVVNCGGVSYASYRLLPILQEVLGHRPDLIVVYTGHNEFLEERTYGHLKTSPALVRGTYRMLSRSRLFSSAVQTWSGPPVNDNPPDRAILPAEVDALLDYRGGLEAYERDDDWRAGVIRHFDWNLRRMAELCRENKVALLLVNPVSNLKDCPPFKVVSDSGLSDEQQEAFEALWQQARQPDLSVEQRIERLQSALRIDPRHAGALFLLGKSYEAQGRDDEARVALERAKDEDACPLRMLQSMHAVLREVADDFDVPLVDVRHQIALESPQQLIGDEWLLDHVHPSIRGHQLIADLLTDELIRRGDVVPRAGWRAARQGLYREHLGSLDTAYFARGKERLEGLRRWTEGRVNKLRGETRNNTDAG